MKSLDQGVYRIIFPDGSWYVGSAKNIKGRCRVHRKLLYRGDHHNSRMQDLWNKWKSLKWERVLVTSDFQEMWDTEERLINETDVGRINVQTIVRRDHF